MSDSPDRIWEETQNSPEFKNLRKRFRSFAFPLTVAFLVWYFAYVLLTAFARDFVKTPVIGNINVAFVLGVLQFLTTFFIAWLYERHSSRHLDAPSEALRDTVEKGLGR